MKKVKVRMESLVTRLISELKESQATMSKLRQESDQLNKRAKQEEERIARLVQEFGQLKTGTHPIYNG